MADIKNITIDGTTYDLKDAKARTDVSDLKEDLNVIDTTLKDGNFTFEQGSLYNGNPSPSEYRGRTVNYIDVVPNACVVCNSDTYDISVDEYNGNVFLSNSDWVLAYPYVVNSGNKIKIIIKRKDDNKVTADDLLSAQSAISVYNVTYDTVVNIENAIQNTTVQVEIRNSLRVGWAHDGSGNYYHDSRSIRNTITTPLYYDYDVTIYCDPSQSISFQFYDGSTTGTAHLTGTTGWIKNYVVPAHTYFCFTLKNDNEATTSTETNDHVHASSAEPINTAVYDNVVNISDIKKALVLGTNYSVNANLSKNNVKLEYVGQLTYLQSFCIYNDHYYSANGAGNISVQDESFSETNNVEIAIGHANSMQLGAMHNNYAYVSGWNDQKIYVVNLDTLQIAETITLPTTGYTTAAVDDVNEIVYIFQRDTDPSLSEEFYNFIVYDYNTEQIISTRKLGRAFAAMQAVEYYEGKIYVLNGLGSTTAPNYYIIYNTNGNIIGEYVLNDFSTNEPEGVYIDRSTKKLYVSFVDRNLYEINGNVLS